MLHISRTERIRRDIIAVSAFLLGLFIVRICRYFLFVRSLTIARYLWYLYYIPYIGLPVLTLDAASCVGKSERMKAPASVKVLWGAAILLMLGYLKLKGDINTDAEVDAKDMARLKRYLADDVKYSLSAAQLQIADVNGDGTADAKDMAKLKRYLADEVKYPL